MSDFAEQLKRAEELAKQHGGLIMGGIASSGGLWLPKPKHYTATVEDAQKLANAPDGKWVGMETTYTNAYNEFKAESLAKLQQIMLQYGKKKPTVFDLQKNMNAHYQVQEIMFKDWKPEVCFTHCQFNYTPVYIDPNIGFTGSFSDYLKPTRGPRPSSEPWDFDAQQSESLDRLGDAMVAAVQERYARWKAECPEVVRVRNRLVAVDGEVPGWLRGMT